MNNNVTLIAHIYNESYLLPFWLEHHKNMVDDIVIVDYKSTDNSLEICKKYNCKILQSKNEMFQAHAIDKEIMLIEEQIKGIKIVLNITEFLFIVVPIKNLFTTENTSLLITSYVPYSNQPYEIDNYNILLNNIINDNVHYHNGTDGVNFRGFRSIHNYLNGNYHLGRHNTYHPCSHTDKLFIVWLGYFPLNNYLINRKLQIKNKIPHSDKINKFGYQHLFTKEKIININIEKYNNGHLLKNLNITLYNLILSYKSHIYYPELLENNNWGENKIIINEDINLLQNTSFNDIGYTLLDSSFNFILNNFIQKKILELTNKTFLLEDYHNHITEEEHNVILNSMPYKKNMLELTELCENIEQIIYDTIKIKIKIFNQDIWFRICRPSNIYSNDFNPCHRDTYLDFYRNTINIYLPICGSNENSSLTIELGSQYWNENETIVTKGGAYFKSTNKKYSVDAIVASKQKLNMIRPNPSINQFMLFSPYLIHGCATNFNLNTTRISVEIRFIKDDDLSLIQEEKFNNFLKNRIWR